MRSHPPNKIRQTITARAGVLASNNCAYKSKEFERTKDCCALTPGDMSEQLQSNNMKTKTEKNHPRVGSRAEWLAARLELLKAEKELTRHSDELAQTRQKLPWVRIDKEYRFETDEGTATLADLFKGCSQLLVYHFMFGPEYTGGCPACSAIVDGFNGFAVHLEHHDVAMIAVSRAPIAALQAYKRRMGWTFTWASSLDSDFNYDFNTSFTEEQQHSGNLYYNYHKGGITSGSEASSEDSQDRLQDDLALTPKVFADMTGTDILT